MFNSEQLQEKWSPLLNHEGLEDIKDPHRKAVTAVLLENQERFLREERDFLYEGTPGQLNNADSVGDINLDPDQADSSDPGVIADAEDDIETQILARIDENDSAGGVHVTIRYIPADGVTSAGAEAVYGMTNARVNA